MNPPTGPLSVPAPELSVYRDHCIALLRRYFCMSVEVGRLPALLGRECFRTQAKDYHVHSFENLVIFVIDVERCLDRLDPFDKELIARIVLQEYTDEEAARLLHCGVRTVGRRLPEALDLLTEIFLGNGMLDITFRVPPRRFVITEPLARCRERIPQRSPNQEGNPPAAPYPAHPRTPPAASRPSPFVPALSSHPRLVKTPKTTIFAQAADSDGNIFLSEVAGLPPPICYAGYVS